MNQLKSLPDCAVTVNTIHNMLGSIFGRTPAAQTKKPETLIGWKMQRKTWTTEQGSQGQSIKWMTAIKRLQTRHYWQHQSPNVCFTSSVCLLIPSKNTPEDLLWPLSWSDLIMIHYSDHSRKTWHFYAHRS